MNRISFETTHTELKRILLREGFSDHRADRCAKLFTENTCDGIYSHGLNRFPRFVQNVREGRVQVDAEPKRVNQLGVIEQWDGQSGVGLLNAEFAMGRAVEMAQEYGMGCVGLKNTNHWMRAGAYGLQAADAGCIGLCWTNTTRLMPPWGSAVKRIGNNPLTLCVPYQGHHVLLDIAMSQYANGKLEVIQRRGEQLPLAGGYDEDGNLTTDPGTILESRRALPIGYWKGSGLALVLDLMATIITGGNSTAEIARQEHEADVSQVFIAIDAQSLSGKQILEETVDRIVRDFKDVPSLEDVDEIRYPGEGMLAIRRDNMKHGIPVEPDIWQQILDM